MSSRDDGDNVSKRLGEYLLKGWTMLNEDCKYGCPVPLMRSRDKRRLCVSCERYMEQDGTVVATLQLPEEVEQEARQMRTPSPDSRNLSPMDPAAEMTIVAGRVFGALADQDPTIFSDVPSAASAIAALARPDDSDHAPRTRGRRMSGLTLRRAPISSPVRNDPKQHTPAVADSTDPSDLSDHPITRAYVDPPSVYTELRRTLEEKLSLANSDLMAIREDYPRQLSIIQFISATLDALSKISG